MDTALVTRFHHVYPEPTHKILGPLRPARNSQHYSYIHVRRAASHPASHEQVGRDSSLVDREPIKVGILGNVVEHVLPFVQERAEPNACFLHGV